MLKENVRLNYALGMGQGKKLLRMKVVIAVLGGKDGVLFRLWRKT